MMSASTKFSGYKIDYAKSSLIVNYKFAAAANDFGTPEYNMVRSILNDYPNFSIEIRAGRTVRSPNKSKRLTYDNMEKHIRVYDNADELLKMFEHVKAASKVVASPYKYVSDWFKMQFPNYRKAPTFDNGRLTILPVIPPEVEGYKMKSEKAV